MIRELGKLLRGVKVQLDKKGYDDTAAERENPLDPGISKNLAENIASIARHFHESSDFVKREFVISSANRRGAVLFIDGMVNQNTIDQTILEPLILESRKIERSSAKDMSTMQDIKERILISSELVVTRKLSEITEKLLIGDTILLVDGEDSAIAANTKGWEKRAIAEPLTESVIRGPRQGFTESIRTNTALLRRIIRNRDLKFDSLVLGERSSTSICVAYIETIANPGIVSLVKERLNKIDVSEVLSSGLIDEMFEEGPATIFETIAYSERPDVVAAKLLEGRVAVIVDGTPFVLTMPMLFIENFISSEDYTYRVGTATFLRLLRVFCYFLSLSAPATYIALANFHQELIPIPLLFTMSASSEGLPFSSAVEMSVMLFIYEILQEAGIRLPKPIGQTISLVGALVMGQAAVEAGIVGAPVMIIVSITAVTSFVTPTLSGSSSMLRWLLIFTSAMFGGIGITITLFCIYLHIVSLTSLGVPILSPIAPIQRQDLKDTIVRAPLWRMKTRPAALKPMDLVRQDIEKPFSKADGPPNGGNK
ncbi:MAG: spore germination protein [Eubacteriaceae bacterium]|jgi:spore germination protein KA|nr:spore germination protein [Eubacteriaceae bacterium]